MKKEILQTFSQIRERDLRDEGIFIAEGQLLVDRLLASGLDVIAVLCSDRLDGRYSGSVKERFQFVIMNDDEIEAIAGYRFHRGVMASCRRPHFQDVPEFLSANTSASRIVICPDLTNAENIGSIMRSASAFGYDAVAVGPKCCDPLSRKALKVSMGAPFNLPVLRIDDEESDARFLKSIGYEIYGASLSGDTIPLTAFRGTERFAIVFGNEASGLSDEWISRCDRLLTIPIMPHSDSLNVGVAAGIFMYHLSPD